MHERRDTLRVLLHDYSGHPFPTSLSRELARRGDDLDHVYCSSYVSGKGRLERLPDDPPTLTFTALEMHGTFDKYSALRRLRQEFGYARTFVRHVRASRPDVIIMCNTPLIAHSSIARALRSLNVPMVFWHQDVYSEAMGAEAKRRLGAIGSGLAAIADRLERNIARSSAAVVVIADSFIAVHKRWRTPTDTVSVIPNWGLLDEIQPGDRDNPFSRRHGLVESPVMLYSGTLGLKHNPENLVQLLRGVRDRVPDANLVIVSEGIAADDLKGRNEPGLLVMPYQPFEDLADVLASGDLLVTILEPTAGRYSVPSKTLSYLCAGRPVLALLPRFNPMFALVEQAGGIARDPALTPLDNIAQDAADLIGDLYARVERGSRARSYAEAHFDVSAIADQFAGILAAAQPVDA